MTAMHHYPASAEDFTDDIYRWATNQLPILCRRPRVRVHAAPRGYAVVIERPAWMPDLAWEETCWRMKWLIHHLRFSPLNEWKAAPDTFTALCTDPASWKPPARMVRVG
jgi:hypothetical protein